GGGEGGGGGGGGGAGGGGVVEGGGGGVGAGGMGGGREGEARGRGGRRRRGQTAHEMLRLDERDAVAVLGELEAGGQSADAATHHDGVAQETSILGLVLAPLAQHRSSRRTQCGELLRCRQRGDAR